MTTVPEGSQWWATLIERFAGVAVAAGVSSPGGRQYRSAGKLSQQPVTPFTTFYAASVTKQLIATLVARAVLDGHIDPRASVSTLLPGLPAWTLPIRVQHLVHHTAALPQPRQLAVALGYSDDAAGWSRLDNEALLIALHRVAPPPVPPGRVFCYDNTGYVVLAELLRAVHGRGVADLARVEIFGPLGATGSGLGGSARAMLPGHAAPPATTGDGGLWTCAADLLTWLEAMNEGRLGADLSDLVQSPGRLEDGTVLDYAWGIGLRPGPAGTLFLHGGEWEGWCAMTARSPTTATAVAILAASENMSTVSAVTLELHERLVTSGRPPPRTSPPSRYPQAT